VSQVQLDPDGWPRAGRRLNLREQGLALVDAVGVKGGLGEVAEERAGHDGVMRRIGPLEQPRGARVGVIVAALSQRAEHPS
jgi:hypothetical protein